MTKTWHDKHSPTLARAIEACATRNYWTPFEESPSRKLHPEGAKQAGQIAFQRHLGSPFALTMPGQVGQVGREVSPYKRQALGITYPKIEVDPLYQAMHAAMKPWAAQDPEQRLAICMEILDRWSRQVFENAFATMHTAGQAFMMAFAGSGANSLDRGLEALAWAAQAMRSVPAASTFTRRFGKREVTLKKRYRLRPRGIAVVISCGSYPAWNAYPAIMANLATGNPVVLKPHPDCILPMAIAVKTAREVLAEAGADPNLLTLAADTWDAPLTKVLLQHKATQLIDFTGGQGFGAWIEENCRHAQVYTETAGCNAVVIDGTDNLPRMLLAIAQSLCIFSSQMCTAAQNIYVPATGVDTPDGRLSPEDFAQALTARIDTLVADPKIAAGLCGALQTPRILEAMTALRARSARLVRHGDPYPHPEYPEACTATPLVAMLDADDRAIAQREHFGPMGFVITARDRDHALACASQDATQFGAIASYAYTRDPAFAAKVEDTFAEAGASVGINLLGQLPINYTAAYSDFHVTGLNPAGNACLTDLAFVAGRFRVVQSKTEVP